jgi:hypothetical protein
MSPKEFPEVELSSPGTTTSPDSTIGSSKTTSSLSSIGSCTSSNSGFASSSSANTLFHHSLTLKHGHCLCQFLGSEPHISLCPRISASG